MHQQVPGRFRELIRKRRWLILGAFNLVCIGFLMVFFESALRISPPAWLRYRMEGLSARSGTTAEIGTDRDWRMVKNAADQIVSFEPDRVFDIVHEEYQHKVEIDEFGGRKLGVVKSFATNTLPFVGDSFTFGLGVKESETFAALLQPQFERRIVNLGIPGSALHGHLRQVRHQFETLGRPEVIIFFVYLGNDLHDVMLSGQAKEKVVKPDSPDQKPAPPKKSTLQKLNELTLVWPFRNLYSVQFTKKTLMGWMSKSSNNVDAKVNSMTVSLEEDYHRHFTNRLDELVALQRELGFRSVFVLIPHKFQVYPEERNAIADYYGLKSSDLDVDLPNRILNQSLVDRDFPVIDATPVLSTEPEVGYYYRYDDHMTPLGHRKFADGISDGLIQIVAKIRAESAASGN